MLIPGLYLAEKEDCHFDRYRVTMEVKETEKSYIFKLVELKSRYGAVHIESFFRKSECVLLRKNKGGHAIRIWSDHDFTFYPFQAGIPYYFKMLQEGVSSSAAIAVSTCYKGREAYALKKAEYCNGMTKEDQE